MSDPLSRVASWLAPAMVAGESPTISVAVDDPVLALIAETARLDALSLAAQNRGDEIFDALPEDIREGRVQVSLNGKLGRLLQHYRGFTSEADLERWVSLHREFAVAFVDDATAAEFDRQIGLDQALAQFRAGREEIKAARETSGCEAHYREAEDLGRRAGEAGNQIRNTKPVTLTGAIAMLEWENEDGRLITSVIAGLRDLREKANRGEAAPRATKTDAEIVAAAAKLIPLYLEESERS
jgi:hypothetical protein